MVNLEINIVSQFGESFCELLGDKNIKEFSQNVGIDLSILYRYKRGEILPTLHHALILTETFGCSLDYLLGLTDNKSDFQKPTPSFAIAFRNILCENRTTRYKLCKNEKIPRQSVDDWYHGIRQPSIDNLLKLASYFHCTLEHLIGRE